MFTTNLLIIKISKRYNQSIENVFTSCLLYRVSDNTTPPASHAPATLATQFVG